MEVSNEDPQNAAAPPTPAEQKAAVKSHMDEAMLAEGDTWYPVPLRWWDAWKAFVGYDDAGEGAGREESFPGTLDTKGLQGQREGELSKQVRLGE
jgi:hypothetical protein